MPRKVKVARGVVPANPLPRPKTAATLTPAIRGNGQHFGKRFTPKVGAPRNRAQGAMPVRLETMIMQIGPSAIALLQDVINAVIPGVTVQQRIDSATTIVQMMTTISTAQMSAYALLTANLDYGKLSDAQLQALQQHRHDVSATMAALTETLYATESA